MPDRAFSTVSFFSRFYQKWYNNAKRLYVKKIGFIIGLILGIIGLYKIDMTLIVGLNYFGKYVFFVLFQLFIIYLYYFSFKKLKGWKSTAASLVLGAILFYGGIKFQLG